MLPRHFVSLAFVAVLTASVVLPSAAQTPAQLQAAGDAAKRDASQDEAVGQVTALQGKVSVTRNNGAPAALNTDAEIFKNDVLQTGPDGTLGITFDDETTFNLSPNTTITVDEFIYSPGAKKNAAVFNVARGTAAFVASQVAKTGDMKIETPTATMGIRGTTGLVEVPDGAGSAGAGDARIKLYPDSDGRVGRIEVFAPGRGGARLGLLTQGSSAFAIRGAAGRFAAVPFAISPQDAARDRGIVQRLYQSHTFGRQATAQRRQIRLQRNLQQRQQLQRPGQRGSQQGQPGQRGLQQMPRNPQRQLQRLPQQQVPNDPRLRRRVDPAVPDQDPQQQQNPTRFERRSPQLVPPRGRILR
jgi:hypothetical protein